MASRFSTCRIQVLLSRTETWEVEALLQFNEGEVKIVDNILEFIVEDNVDKLGWDPEEEIRKGKKVMWIEQILIHLMAKNAVSVTLLKEYYSNDDHDGHKPSDYYEELLSQVPTLVIREVLAKRCGG